MDDSIPSISSGPVGSRFVSQDELDSARARRDEQWKAAYARLGQAPPPQPVDDAFDGRSLAEKLAANRAAKQEEWEERNKLANQFRALEEDEVKFLDSIKSEQERQERRRKEEDAEEVKGFKQAIAARNALPPKPTLPFSNSPSSSSNTPTASSREKAPPKKPAKNMIKGLIVKKRKLANTDPSSTAERVSEVKKGPELDTEGPVKRRRPSSPS